MIGLSVSCGHSQVVSCLANNSLFPLSLTTLTSSGTDWYVIVAVEPVCQILDHHHALRTSDSSTLHLVQVSNEFDIVLFLGFVVSVIDPASSASLLNGSRGVKKIVCLPSLRSFPPATNPISAMEC